ncbi:MAG: hypothetical protein WA823_06950 [Candidatus Acidiferrales bacterium]
MAGHKRTKEQIIADMADIVVRHLEAMPKVEQKARIKAFKQKNNEGRESVQSGGS